MPKRLPRHRPCSRTACGCGELSTRNLEWSQCLRPTGDPEEQRDMVRFVVCGREVAKPVTVEIRDGQVHRILVGGTRPRHIEAAVPHAGQRENRADGASSATWPVPHFPSDPDLPGGSYRWTTFAIQSRLDGNSTGLPRGKLDGGRNAGQDTAPADHHKVNRGNAWTN